MLLRRYYRSVELFFSTKLTSRQQVDDLLQRTFLQCVESRDGWRERGSFRSYLLGIARHVLLRHFRWQRRHGQRFEALEVSVEDLGQGPFDAMVEHDEHHDLAKALRKIPLDFQITLELVYWHGLSTTEISAVLGIADATVRTRILRAKRMLRAVMPPRGSATEGPMP